MSTINVAMLGAGGVGKTCVLLRLTRKSFDPEYIPTIQDHFEAKILAMEREFILKIVDTAGQDEMADIAGIAIQSSEAFILVYSITSTISLNEVEKYRSKILSLKPGAEGKMILVGNKCDLENDRQVPREKGQSLADSWGIPFFETSAKENINIETIFQDLAIASTKKVNSNAQSAETQEQADTNCSCNIA
ncbi:Ras-like protein rasG [Tritrichomonas foetus]|uniref:Ras-like protein rasG n=1 Tax=Tritrichomonas foetus TaxID=1144522 RepID=A0A1J4K4V8_9EUKA|nr:Ras-like protein rasG [Tritrichomonas foetus]|eukprot:OHT05896.1 Ras-like protein rasG [Tritrichomonas foetus]